MSFPVVILCGNPPLIESTEQVWNNTSTLGSTVLYICKEGFHNKGGHNVSICNENSEWTPATLSCQGNSHNALNKIVVFKNVQKVKTDFKFLTKSFSMTVVFTYLGRNCSMLTLSWGEMQSICKATVWSRLIHNRYFDLLLQ